MNLARDGGATMKLPRRRQFLHLAAGAAALPAVSRVRVGASLSDADSHGGFSLFDIAREIRRIVKPRVRF